MNRTSANALLDQAFHFFQLLSEEAAELPGGYALVNLSVPLFLSNAAWYPQSGALQDVAAWYAERNLPPALIVPTTRDATLERTLQEGPFMLEQTFAFRQPSPSSPSGSSNDVVVEQASWAHARTAGELIAAHYGLPEYSVALGSAITRAMQEDPKVGLYIAYGTTAEGAMVTFETPQHLIAMLHTEPHPHLDTRFHAEALDRNLVPLILSPTETAGQWGLERWSIQ